MIFFKKGDIEVKFDWDIAYSIPGTGEEVDIRANIEQGHPTNISGVVVRKSWYYSISNNEPMLTITLE
jgi:hypothetical protein